MKKGIKEKLKAGIITLVHSPCPVRIAQKSEGRLSLFCVSYRVLNK